MSSKKTVGLILVILGFVLIALAGIHTISNPEIFTHIALGQAGNASTDPLSYTLANQPWINLHPLYNQMAHGLWELGGAPLITLSHTAAVLAAFILMLRFGKAWGGALSQGLALLLCTWLLLPVFNPGPTAFFLLFSALFATLLYRVKNFTVLAASLLILQVLWTNIHPSFLFGPLLILVSAIANWKETQTRKSLVTPLTNRLLTLSAAALLVTLINPNFINLHRHILANASTLTGTEGLEWISLFSSGFPSGFISKLTIFALVLGAGGLITLQKKLPIMITMLAVVGAFLTVRSIGALQSFALLALPFLILSFSAIGEYISRTMTTILKTKEEVLHLALTVITLLLMVVTAISITNNNALTNMGSASRFGLGLQNDAFPVAAAGILEREDFPERILNLAHDGGYLSTMNPERKIFCDTRTTLYGTEFYKTLDRALLGQAASWDAIWSDWNPHAIVMNGAWIESGALVNRVVASRAWKMIYFDGATTLLVRDLPEYETLINDPSIQKHGISVLENARSEYIKKSGGFIKPGNSSRLIGAGALFLALNRADEAESIYSLLVENSPLMSTAWLGLGQSLILQRQITKGLDCMERAARISPRNARAWMGLLQAYRMKGDETGIQTASEKLNQFFKADQATVEQQEATTQKKKPADTPQKTDELPLPAELK